MKRSYQKPKIKEVKLRPEEAVLKACKQYITGNPQSSKCQCSNNQNKAS